MRNDLHKIRSIEVDKKTGKHVIITTYKNTIDGFYEWLRDMYPKIKLLRHQKKWATELFKIYNGYPIQGDKRDEKGNEWFMAVSPLGTIWQTIGTHLFYREIKQIHEQLGERDFNRVSVCYCTPHHIKYIDHSSISEFILPKNNSN